MHFEAALPDTKGARMCLRDYIATSSMAAILRSEAQGTSDVKAIAVAAYKAADAVLEAREPAPPDRLQHGPS